MEKVVVEGRENEAILYRQNNVLYNCLNIWPKACKPFVYYMAFHQSSLASL